MKFQLYVISFFLSTILFCCSIDETSNADRDTLVKAFNEPPESTRPWVYWYWLSDNISKEGITKDIEAMAQVGIGEAFIGNILDRSGQVPMGDIQVLTEEWWDCIDHAIIEAERVGVKIGMFNCPGWSMAGGPWVKPEQSMRYITSNELKVTGPEEIEVKLENPSENFQRVSLQAYPEPEFDDFSYDNYEIQVISSDNIENPEFLFDSDQNSFASFVSYPAHIEIEFDKPISARSIELVPVHLPMSATIELFYLSDSKDWIKIANRKIERESLRNDVGFIRFAPIVESFQVVKAKRFRLQFSDLGMVQPNARMPYIGRLSEITLSNAARLSHYPEKQLAKMAPTPWAVRWDSYLWDESADPESKELVIEKDKVIDLNSFIDEDGILRWEVPEGNWIILNSGMVPTGTKNHPVTAEGEGLEVDKMNKEHLESHFDEYIGEVLRRLPSDRRKNFRHVVADSYEQGAQNWTEGFAEEFQKAYGYSPYPWLPVFTGKIVESADHSDRFLWDVRRLVADMIASNFVGGFKELCRENGLRLWLENYGHWGFPGEFLNYGGASEDIGGEFWFPDTSLGPTEVRCATSAGHIYGKQIISAEAFTSRRTFYYTPRDLRAIGDWAWTEGINHFVLHLYMHQPFDDKKPGVSAWFGTDFNRNTTWFSSAVSYFDYLKRSSSILQQGSPVADVAYFIGDDTPKMMGIRDPELPKGYDYDYINSEVLIEDAEVQDGKIVLSSGVSYRVLVLPPQATMRPELLKRIQELVHKGAVVLGPKPDRSPSMKNYPECDMQLQTMASELWGNVDGVSIKEGSYGKGKIFSGTSLEDVFSSIMLGPDIELNDSILYTHRNLGNVDVYFLSNQKRSKLTDTISFRVTGKQPELWNAVSGKIRILPQFTIKGGRTYIPLEFAQSESYFIVFSDNDTKKTEGFNFPRFETITNLDGSWNVSFNPEYGAPAEIEFNSLSDWTKNSLETIKYYSGRAVYKKSFEFSGDITQKHFLNLGRVEALSTVRLNGEEFDTQWCSPYRMDISSFLKKGVNNLEIEVVNPWWNRLVGDVQKNGQSYTYATYIGWDENSTLLPSGLLGPVTIEMTAN
jgi:hypothetical protein